MQGHENTDKKTKKRDGSLASSGIAVFSDLYYGNSFRADGLGIQWGKDTQQHQLYLALSSALQLVNAEYCGQYACTVTEIYIADPDDPTKQIYDHTEKTFEQLTGKIENRSVGALLVDDFDYIFGLTLRCSREPIRMFSRQVFVSSPNLGNTP